MITKEIKKLALKKLQSSNITTLSNESSKQSITLIDLSEILNDDDRYNIMIELSKIFIEDFKENEDFKVIFENENQKILISNKDNAATIVITFCNYHLVVTKIESQEE